MKILAKLFATLAIITGLVAAYSWVVFVVKFLTDVFHYNLPFWQALFTNITFFVLVEVIALLLTLFLGALAFALAETKKKSNRWMN